MPLTEEYRAFWLDGVPGLLVALLGRGGVRRLEPPLSGSPGSPPPSEAGSSRWTWPGGVTATG